MFLELVQPLPFVRCCSFCCKEQRDVRLLVTASTSHNPAICNECADKAVELMKEKEA